MLASLDSERSDWGAIGAVRFDPERLWGRARAGAAAGLSLRRRARRRLHRALAAPFQRALPHRTDEAELARFITDLRQVRPLLAG